MTKKISFQGEHGAYSDMACRAVYPDYETVPCVSFDAALNVVSRGEADLAMIPVDNSIAGRVADVHHLLPNSGLHIIGEHFQPIHHCLLGVKGASIDDVKTIHSHLHALPQCRDIIKQYDWTKIVEPDTATAAKKVSEAQDKTQAAIASHLAGELYDLDVLRKNIQDHDHNTTRFLIMSPDPVRPALHDHDPIMTSFVFDVMSVPAALYKALGGFATNGINIIKLESYMINGDFSASRFYTEVESHPDDPAMKHAMRELEMFTDYINILGVYPADAFRYKT